MLYYRAPNDIIIKDNLKQICKEAIGTWIYTKMWHEELKYYKIKTIKNIRRLDRGSKPVLGDWKTEALSTW